MCLFARAPPISNSTFSNAFEDLGRQPCAPFSTPSWPPRFPSSQVRLPAAALRGRAQERGGDRSWFWLYLVGAGGWDRPIAPRRSAPPGAFFMECSRLVYRHWPRPRAGASKPDRSDGAHWAPHLIAGRQSDSQARACIVHHVHLSLRHRRRRAFLPRRFVFARSAPVHAWRAVGEGHRGRGRPIAPRPHLMSLAVQASLQLSGWSLR